MVFQDVSPYRESIVERNLTCIKRALSLTYICGFDNYHVKYVGISHAASADSLLNLSSVGASLAENCTYFWAWF